MVYIDKKPCFVLTNKTDYQEKLQKMVDDGIKNGIYKVSQYNTLKDLNYSRGSYTEILKI